MEETTQQAVTYSDKMAQLVLLSQQLPVGSYWKDDSYIYKIKRLELGEVVLAVTARITMSVGDPQSNSLYDYQIQESPLFITNIPSLSRSTDEQYKNAITDIGKIYELKNNELFQKQCLLNTPTDIPFDDFDTLHDEIIQLQGDQYFFYEPTAHCFRVFKIDMRTYNGGDTLLNDWHFYMDSNDVGTHILAAKRDGIQLSNILGDNKLYPITEFQFKGLVEFIENKPNE